MTTNEFKRSVNSNFTFPIFAEMVFNKYYMYGKNLNETSDASCFINKSQKILFNAIGEAFKQKFYGVELTKYNFPFKEIADGNYHYHELNVKRKKTTEKQQKIYDCVEKCIEFIIDYVCDHLESWEDYEAFFDHVSLHTWVVGNHCKRFFKKCKDAPVNAKYMYKIMDNAWTDIWSRLS